MISSDILSIDFRDRILYVSTFEADYVIAVWRFIPSYDNQLYKAVSGDYILWEDGGNYIITKYKEVKTEDNLVYLEEYIGK